MPKTSLVFPFTQTHIKLTDYPYQKEVEIRLKMAHLTDLEVKLLQEIVHQSLHISVQHLADHLEIAVEDLIPILDKWSETKLFKRHDLQLTIDKEMRKSIEFQLEKFEENFEPNLNFLQTILNRLPQAILIDWYAISRSAHDFFSFIVERFFINPQVYLYHLEQLTFKNPVLRQIQEEVFRSPHLCVRVDDLKKKFHLTHEKFELDLLILEFHFVCCLSYRHVDGHWEEVVTPFAEWQEILKYQAHIQKAYLDEPISETYLSGIPFIETLKTDLQSFQKKKGKESPTLSAELTQLGLLADHQVTEQGEKWLKQTFHEQVMTLFSYFSSEPSFKLRFKELWQDRQLRLIDKSLRYLDVNRWIIFDLFIKGLIISLGDRDPLTLKLKGKRWKYQFPTYTDLEKEFIQVVILERLSRLGVVEVGEWQGRHCFRLTPFGAHFIS